MTDQTNKGLPELSMARHDLFDLSTELLGVIEDVKNGMPFDDVCMETIISVRERLACLDALSASAPAAGSVPTKAYCRNCDAVTSCTWRWNSDTCADMCCDECHTVHVCVHEFSSEVAYPIGQLRDKGVPSDLTADHIDRFEASLSDLGPATRQAAALVCALAKNNLLARYGGAAWQPIETAPKDGTSVLLRGHGDHRIADGYWLKAAYNGNGAWVWPYVHREPTHWMPLPPAPQEGK